MKNKQLGRQADRKKISQAVVKTVWQTFKKGRLFLVMADWHLDRQTLGEAESTMQTKKECKQGK